MPTSPTVQLVSLIALGICLLAIWKGGSAERVGSGLILGIALGRLITGQFFSPDMKPVLILIGDGLTAMGLLAVALRYGSLWLGGAMLLYAAQFTLHSYYFVTARPNDNFHAAVNNIDFFGIILCLAFGALVSWRRRMIAARPKPRLETVLPSNNDGAS
jgi:hypothetical protein